MYKISSVTGEGVQDLLTKVVQELKELPKEELTEVEERVVYTLKEEEPSWTIRKENDVFIIEGKAVEKLMGRINLSDNESMYYFHRKLIELGIEDKLKEMHVCQGDTVIIDGYELEWFE